ncbi:MULTISPECIES: preprotein translocase subunit SecE [Brochothrix]|uniref:Protein translocase subunit SecE n=1 Tax=Brochothrix thermosphacta TaxID=2756 RepID=A0A1D2KCN4_BROTH|nr:MULTISPECIES: preprotein translocase subunit SecE [Brochothrix]SLM91412.1 Preprotein translocase subunit SecE (TC 3.A.5.1.1) [Brachybacterium faecium]ANZ95063.1 preprotein translocase subunit SecE [Brochothrix thermosphacta]ANZ96634.1 preprotein translocase subunit SecE [Brochothrix thermosphacta]ATF26051.1 preprotein translocase subunit SecE [Brochothrix thermosphacta]ATH85391.1 preprotein translocase subunit SecE [Brochothrix thermosphacta]
MASKQGFFKGVKSELGKVVWPTGKEVINYTTIVVFTVVFLALFFMLTDWGIGSLVEMITKD